MNKKGFTLIEVLLVIVLLAAVSVTVGVNMSAVSNRNNLKEIENYKKQIEDAACLYAEVNNITENKTITIKRLLSDGFLRNDMINPETKESITKEEDIKIEITFENNEKICKMKERTS